MTQHEYQAMLALVAVLLLLFAHFTGTAAFLPFIVPREFDWT